MHFFGSALGFSSFEAAQNSVHPFLTFRCVTGRLQTCVKHQVEAASLSRKPCGARNPPAGSLATLVVGSEGSWEGAEAAAQHGSADPGTQAQRRSP